METDRIELIHVYSVRKGEYNTVGAIRRGYRRRSDIHEAAVAKTSAVYLCCIVS